MTTFYDLSTVRHKGSAEDFQILASKEYGASYALLELAKELGLDYRHSE